MSKCLSILLVKCYCSNNFLGIMSYLDPLKIMTDRDPARQKYSAPNPDRNLVVLGVHHDHVRAGQRAQGDRETAGGGNYPFKALSVTYIFFVMFFYFPCPGDIVPGEKENS